MNIEILAARLASLVPEMAHDCPTNNAEKIKQEILEEMKRGRRVNAQLPKVYVDDVTPEYEAAMEKAMRESEVIISKALRNVNDVMMGAESDADMFSAQLKIDALNSDAAIRAKRLKLKREIMARYHASLPEEPMPPELAEILSRYSKSPTGNPFDFSV